MKMIATKKIRHKRVAPTAISPKELLSPIYRSRAGWIIIQALFTKVNLPITQTIQQFWQAGVTIIWSVIS